MRTLITVCTLLLLLASCSSSSDEPTSQPTPTGEPSDPQTSGSATSSDTPGPVTIPESDDPPTQVDLQLAPLVQLTAPVGFANRAGSDSLFVAEQVGRVVEIELGSDGRVPDEPREILNITERVIVEGEQGLLGIAFSPTGDRLYAVYTNLGGDNSLVSWTISDDGVADLDTELEHLEVFQPHANHNGGQILFGPDGHLYYGLGDGGGAGDPEESGQDRSTLLGSILRIDPDPVAGGYSIPADNPFVDEPGAAPEAWAYGLRNPWRFSFDSATGDLWVGDVGQDEVEEITYLAASEGGGSGANLGWNAFEGSRRFADAEAPGHVPPLLEYLQDDGRCSVIGGYVYRGAAIAELEGIYLYSDLCDGVIRGVLPGVGSGPLLEAPSASAISFGEGPDGEIYFIEEDGVVSRIEAQSS